MNKVLLDKLVAIKKEIDLEIAKETAEISGIKKNIKNIQDLMTTEIVNDLDELNELRKKLGLCVGMSYEVDTGYELRLIPCRPDKVCTIAIAFFDNGDNRIHQYVKSNRNIEAHNIYDIFRSNERKWKHGNCNEVYKNWKEIKTSAEMVIVNDFVKKYDVQLSAINTGSNNVKEMLKETQRIFTGLNGD